MDLRALRRRAFAVGYRMLGSVAEAEDIAQESLLRVTGQQPAPENPTAWVTTVSTRLSIDHLRLARVQREVYVGPWLPEPLVVDQQRRPDEHAELADSVSLALLVVLEHLTPLERAAFLLRDCFGYDYAGIAAIIGGSQVSCRQLVSRARTHVQTGVPRFDADPAHGRVLLHRFLAAAERGDLAGLEAMLAEDVVLFGGGGGKAKAAAHPVAGAAAVATFLIDIAAARRGIGGFEMEIVTVNGQPGRLLRDSDHRVWDVLSIEVVHGRVSCVRIVRNPDKLRHLGRVTSGSPDPSTVYEHPRTE